jgi:putative ABC transport system permease protein
LTFEYRIPGSEFLRLIGSYRGFPYYEIAPDPSLVMERMYDHLQNVPGVVSVAGVSHRPLNSLLVPTLTIAAEDESRAPGTVPPPTASYLLVTPKFFATMKATLVCGRDFDARDLRSAPWVAVVNETAAARLWPGEDPLGKRFRLDTGPDEQPREVIGVVRDLPLSHAQTDSKAVVYASYLQQPTRYRGPWANIVGQMTFVLRTPGHPADLVPAARKAVADVDPDRPISNIAPVMLDVALGVRRRRPFAFVLSGFALAATMLAGIGVYGLMSYSVALRTREIGIRRALGATSRDISMMVGRYAAVLVAGGLVVGLAGAFALTRLIASQLWGVTPTDPRTYAGVSLLLVLVALLAAVVPVRSAVRVDPTVALKYE